MNRHEPLQSTALRFGTNSFLLRDPLYKLVSQVPLFILSRLLSSPWVSRTGSTSDWYALQEALHKCIDTIQYNRFLSHDKTKADLIDYLAAKTPEYCTQTGHRLFFRAYQWQRRLALPGQ